MFKCGYVVIAGQPNVGKSTLLNQIIGERLSIVTCKPQTTRMRVVGILNGDDYQIVFWDTPGLFEPNYLLQEKMVKEAWKAIKEADLVVMLKEVEKKSELKSESFSQFEEVLKRLNKMRKKVILGLNKIDLMRKEDVLLEIDRIAHKDWNMLEIVPFSALKGFGLDRLLEVVIKHMPYGEPLYPEDILTEHPERFFVSEIVREKLFLNLEEEIPYATAVIVDEFRESDKSGKDFIRCVICVEKESQKGIVIGKKGKMLKKIGSESRGEIEKFLERNVYLELWVKVKKNWRKSETLLREIGYE